MTRVSTQNEFRPTFDWKETKESVICEIRGVFMDPVLENISVISLNNQSVFISVRLVSKKYYIAEFNLFSTVKKLTVFSKNAKHAMVEFQKQKTVLWNRKVADMVTDFGEKNDQYIILQMPKKLKLIRKSFISPCIMQLSFQYPSLCYFSVPIGYHMCLYDNEDPGLYRPYTVTPSSLGSKKFTVPEALDSPSLYFIIKIYPDGKFTPNLSKFDKGKTVTATGPHGEFEVELLSQKEHVFLIAAGTGMTPMLRIIGYIFAISDMTSVKLILANRVEKDIIWRYQLDSLAEQDKRFRVEYILSDPDPTWTGYKGRVDTEFLKKSLEINKSASGVAFIICGPRNFTSDVEKSIKSLAFKSPTIYCFS